MRNKLKAYRSKERSGIYAPRFWVIFDDGNNYHTDGDDPRTYLTPKAAEVLARQLLRAAERVRNANA